eukprot:Gb_19576 [translate_table: standard]
MIFRFEDSFLKPEDIIQALYPCGQQGALEAGCVTWSLDDLKDIIQQVQEERSTNALCAYEDSWTEKSEVSETDSIAGQRGSILTDQNAFTVQDLEKNGKGFVSLNREASNLCDRALEAFVEAYGEAKKSGSLDDFELDEQAEDIIHEFLDKYVNRNNNVKGTEIDHVRPDVLSLQDILQSSAASNLRSALLARYGSKSLHVMTCP